LYGLRRRSGTFVAWSCDRLCVLHTVWLANGTAFVYRLKTQSGATWLRNCSLSLHWRDIDKLFMTIILTYPGLHAPMEQVE
jgi:hypothetical protein